MPPVILRPGDTLELTTTTKVEAGPVDLVFEGVPWWARWLIRRYAVIRPQPTYTVTVEGHYAAPSA